MTATFAPNLFLGPARVDCPECGQEHVSARYGFGRYLPDGGGRAFCEDCAVTLVPAPELELVEMLDNVDGALFGADLDGVGEQRMRLMLKIIRYVASDMVESWERHFDEKRAALPEPDEAAS